jgi:hypothetical protein
VFKIFLAASVTVVSYRNQRQVSGVRQWGGGGGSWAVVGRWTDMTTPILINFETFLSECTKTAECNNTSHIKRLKKVEGYIPKRLFCNVDILSVSIN